MRNYFERLHSQITHLRRADDYSVMSKEIYQYIDQSKASSMWLQTSIMKTLSTKSNYHCTTDDQKYKQDDKLSQRDRAAWCHYSFGQKWKTGTGRQYFTDIIGLSSTTVI